MLGENIFLLMSKLFPYFFIFHSLTHSLSTSEFVLLLIILLMEKVLWVLIIVLMLPLVSIVMLCAYHVIVLSHTVPCNYCDLICKSLSCDCIILSWDYTIMWLYHIWLYNSLMSQINLFLLIMRLCWLLIQIPWQLSLLLLVGQLTQRI